jgi:membrane protease YdiL (CAAX protease family)
MSPPLKIWFCVGVILIVGILLELFAFDQAFARSGSVVVAIAISLVFANYHFDGEIEYYKNLCSDHLGYKQAQSILEQGEADGWQEETTSPTGMQRFDPHSSPESKAYHESFVEQYDYGNRMMPTFKSIRGRTLLAEFIFGAVGTLIWGFGDLLPKIT